MTIRFYLNFGNWCVRLLHNNIWTSKNDVYGCFTKIVLYPDFVNWCIWLLHDSTVLSGLRRLVFMGVSRQYLNVGHWRGVWVGVARWYLDFGIWTLVCKAFRDNIWTSETRVCGCCTVVSGLWCLDSGV